MSSPLQPSAFRVLGLVPARGGSKGAPRKNIRLIDGRPLLWYTADTALRAQNLSRLILSTDDAETADVGRECGLEVPFMRPPELARDDTPTLPVLQHALTVLEAEGDRFDAVCLLQPTNPLRRAATIDACISLLERSGVDAVMTVQSVPLHYNPHWVYFRSADGTLRLATGEPAPIPRRQALPPAFHRDGSVYVTRREVLLNGSVYGDRTLGMEVDDTEAINIDSEDDFNRAAAALRERVT